MLFPSAQVKEEEDESLFLNSKAKERKKAGVSKKISSGCQQQ